MQLRHPVTHYPVDFDRALERDRVEAIRQIAKAQAQARDWTLQPGIRRSDIKKDRPKAAEKTVTRILPRGLRLVK